MVEASGVDGTLLTLPGRHWKWRMRGSAPWFADRVAELDQRFDVVLATGYVAAADLRGLAPGLRGVPLVLYMHDNQLAYPVRDEHTGERDTHFGFTQILSCLAADAVWFNSVWNRDSFLAEARTLLRRLPDAAPLAWVDRIAARAHVVGYPLELDPRPWRPVDADTDRGPLIVWNHRWEHDKAPEVAFDALCELLRRGVPFRLAVCGQRFRKVPACFERAKAELAERIVHWGWLPDRGAYLDLLARADIALSTARHEFFGVSMLEATHAGARPLVPDALSYVELFPDAFRYTEGTLVAQLEALTRRYLAGEALRADRRTITDPHDANIRTPELVHRLAALVTERR